LSGANTTDLTAETLLKQADVAMYSAKRTRAGGVAVFSTEMKLVDANDVGATRLSGKNVTPTGATRLLSRLRTAIDDGLLSVEYQPKYLLGNGRIIGVEALVRWPHPQLGLLTPESFLPLARQNGLMGAVTDLVLNRAADDAAKWHTLGFAVPFAINVFPPALSEVSLASKIAKAMADRHLPFNHVTVEITEDQLLGNPERAREVLGRLHDFGIRVAIDDFGSGYSGLEYLRQLPIDELKLGKSLVAPISEDSRAAVIVRKLVEMTRDLGMVSVAEGVQSAAIVDLLTRYGCDVVQGYHLSPPVGAAELPRMVSMQHPLTDRAAALAARNGR
jgi:EAL domain-containing protein (putative c-di-GMP-specific phosphodiesterase class I)